MVARSPSRAGDYTPAEPARVAVAADGTVAAVCEPSRITLLALPDGVPFAEIEVDPEAIASEVGWLGAPPRLLVLSRYEAYCTAHLLDPQGPRPIAEIRLEAPMRLCATVGAAALVIGGPGAAVLAASETHLTTYAFQTRSVPLTAGAAAGQFVVALPGSIEEWDPHSRMPRRRLRLPRAAAITAVGGSERVVWMTTQHEPARIDVIPLVNRGQQRAHDLPESIASIAGHPRSDLVACIGAETGRVYVVDLDGRHPTRILAPDGDGRIESAALVIGRMTGVLAAQAGRAVMIAPLDGRDDGEPAARATPAGRVGAGARSEPALAARTAGDQPAAAGGAGELPRTAQRPASLSLDRSAPASSPAVAIPAKVAAAEAPAPGLAAEAIDPDLPIGHAAPAFAATPEPALPAVASPASPVASPTRPGEPAPARGPGPAARSPSSSAAGAPALRAAPVPGAPSRGASTTGSGPLPSASARFSAWRDLVRQSESPPGEPGASPRPEPPTAPRPEPPTAPRPEPPTAPRPEPPTAPRPEPPTALVAAVAPEAPRPDPPAALASPHAAPVAPVAPAAPVGPVAAVREEPRATWRDEVVAWTRGFAAGAMAPDAPAAPPIDALIARFDLAPALHPVLVLLYGAHLCGERGVAPAEIARVLDRRWDEALGRGELAERGVAEYAGSRIALAPLVLRALDELPPATGVLVGQAGSALLLGPCVVVAGDEPLLTIAERCAPRVGGAILAATGEPARAQLVLEARARGAAPMLRATLDAAPGDAAIFVISDPELAERLGLPRLA
jgi:hypothetical protein